MMSIALTGDIMRISFVAAGGAAGLILGATLSIFIINEKVIDTAAAWVLVTPLMYGLSKIACFVSGCCYGIRYRGPFNVIYVAKGNDSFFPIQLLESIFFVIIFFIGLLLYLKLADKRLLVARLVVILSAITKIGLEYLRFNHAERGVSGYQVIIFIIACAAYLLVVFIDKKCSKPVKN
jgi:prolipoprotein diacylglyceryltransferase